MRTPGCPRFRSLPKLRVLRPLALGPQGQPSTLLTPHGRPGVQVIFANARGQAPHAWPLVRQSISTGFPANGAGACCFLSPNFPCPNLFATLRCPAPLCNIPSTAVSPHPVVPRSQGAVVRPLSHHFLGPVPSFHPSSRVYTPPGCQQPSGAGLLTVDRFVLLAWLACIPSPFSAQMLRSLDQPRMIQPHLPFQGPIGLPQ